MFIKQIKKEFFHLNQSNLPSKYFIFLNKINYFTFRRYVYGYSSGTVTSALISPKLLGDSPIFITRNALNKISNGITQYYSVGNKYTEFIESALLRDLHHTVVPDPLVWVHRNSIGQEGSSNEYYNTLRRLDPLINNDEFSKIHELFLILQYYVDKSQNPPPEIIAKSNRDFGGKQNRKNYQYGFSTQNEFIVSNHFNGEKWLMEAGKGSTTLISKLELIQ
jgi:hypothetical protein